VESFYIEASTPIRAATTDTVIGRGPEEMKKLIGRMVSIVYTRLELDRDATVQEIVVPDNRRHLVSDVTFDPPSGRRVLYNQKVSISFSYATREQGGVHIFVTPFFGDTETPNPIYGTPRVYPAGKGTGATWFTFVEGANIDRVRIRMYTINHDRILFEDFVPVRYTFRPQ